MCLALVDEKTFIPKTEWGYKIFRNIQDTSVDSEVRRTNWRRGKWVKARGERIRYNHHAGFHGYTEHYYYPAGFHVYLSEREAKLAVCSPYVEILRVQFRNVVASGKQRRKDRGRTIIAKEIFIPLPVRKKVTK